MPHTARLHECNTSFSAYNYRKERPCRLGPYRGQGYIEEGVGFVAVGHLVDLDRRYLFFGLCDGRERFCTVHATDQFDGIVRIEVSRGGRESR